MANSVAALRPSPRAKPARTKSAQKRSTAPKGETKRMDILMAAAAVFSRKGYAETTLSDIAGHLGGHAAGLYYYFENKDAIVEALLKLTTERIAAEAARTLAAIPDATPIEKLKAMIRSFVGMVANRDDIGRAFQKIYDQVSPELRQSSLAAPRAFAVMWRETIEAAVEQGELRADVSPRLLRMILIGSMHWIPDWYKASGENTPDEIAEAIITVFLEGAVRKASTTYVPRRPRALRRARG